MSSRGVKEQIEYSILTTEIVKTQNPQGFLQNKKAARQGGSVAGNARKELETRTGKKIVSSDNYLPEGTKKRVTKKGQDKRSD